MKSKVKAPAVTYPVVHVLRAVSFLTVEVVAAMRHGCDELRMADEWVNSDEKESKSNFKGRDVEHVFVSVS